MKQTTDCAERDVSTCQEAQILQIGNAVRHPQTRVSGFRTLQQEQQQ